MKKDNIACLADNKVTIKEGTILLAGDLPLKKGIRKPVKGVLNGTPCVIFRKNSCKSALRYLMKEYPEMSCFESYQAYSATIIESFIEHSQAYRFQIEYESQRHDLLVFIKKPLWETAGKDFQFLINYIHYCEDCSNNPDGVFMDDYVLC